MAEPVPSPFHPAPSQLASYPPPGAPHLSPPGLAEAAAGPGGVWRRGNILVMTLGAALPARCVKCNAAAVLPVKERTLYWHHPALYLLVVVQVLLYAIVAMIVRKKALVKPGLCVAHQRRRNRWILAGWLSPVAIVGLAILAGSLGQDGGAVALLAIPLLLIAIVVSMRQAQLLVATRIDERYVQVKGCGEPFLAGFPPALGPDL